MRRQTEADIRPIVKVSYAGVAKCRQFGDVPKPESVQVGWPAWPLRVISGQVGPIEASGQEPALAHRQLESAGRAARCANTIQIPPSVATEANARRSVICSESNRTPPKAALAGTDSCTVAAQVFEDAFDNTGIIDGCNDAQAAAAVGTFQRSTS